MFYTNIFFEELSNEQCNSHQNLISKTQVISDGMKIYLHFILIEIVKYSFHTRVNITIVLSGLKG